MTLHKNAFRTFAAFVLLMTLPLALSTPASAHAKLVVAAPAANSTVAPPAPTELRLSFSEPLELAFTKLMVVGPDGQLVGTRPLSLDPVDTKTLVVPITGAFSPGLVTINWTAVADDGHKSQGSYTLTITD